MIGHGYGPGGSGGGFKKICLRISKNGSRRRGYKKEERLISAATVSESMVLIKTKLQYCQRLCKCVWQERKRDDLNG